MDLCDTIEAEANCQFEQKCMVQEGSLAFATGHGRGLAGRPQGRMLDSLPKLSADWPSQSRRSKTTTTF